MVRTSGKSVDEQFSDIFFYDVVDVVTKSDDNFVVTESDISHAMKVLSEFCEMEPGFTKFIQDDKNWQIEGDDETGKKVYSSVTMTKLLDEECCG
jgi:hypothetical protein